MEMKCLRENLQMERLVGSAQGQAAVEGEITLPGGLREEARVLSAGAMVVLENVEAQQDKVMLEGRVVFHALYTQGDPDKPQAMEAARTLPIPSSCPAPRPGCSAGEMPPWSTWKPPPTADAWG